MAYEVEMCEDKRYIDTLLASATMPFSVKLVVAPIVDYLPRNDRREYQAWDKIECPDNYSILFGVTTVPQIDGRLGGRLQPARPNEQKECKQHHIPVAQDVIKIRVTFLDEGPGRQIWSFKGWLCDL